MSENFLTTGELDLTHKPAPRNIFDVFAMDWGEMAEGRTKVMYGSDEDSILQGKKLTGAALQMGQYYKLHHIKPSSAYSPDVLCSQKYSFPTLVTSDTMQKRKLILSGFPLYPGTTSSRHMPKSMHTAFYEEKKP
ncbi:hypothetical protein DUI87_22905 [Hirundo rustica rustica]|uniref:Uncharacterized protein n=1 Tax=Hirundo rustica rustica TaxID=333673 RepID=A0A3M0JGN4_HIRRU|nr:hypothetical protein DUI87_22905 [Hirundo rustica rustica]